MTNEWGMEEVTDLLSNLTANRVKRMSVPTGQELAIEFVGNDFEQDRYRYECNLHDGNQWLFIRKDDSWTVLWKNLRSSH